ncbi:MAG TPA: Hpt domain-containing protein, partial [Acidobacteriaceae bacterium]|nr:Hpt domain-containing protein [Acidobacteriaceae bacterium]
MKIDLTQFRQTFLQESADHLATMESGLLALRTHPEDDETLHAVFRSAHSIKGGAGSVGLEALARFTHGMENLLDRLRAHEMAISEAIIAELLAAVDALHTLLGAEPGAELPEDAQRLAERIEALATGESQAAEPVAAAAAAEANHGEMAAYRVTFRPDREMFQSGTNPIVLLRNLASLGDVSVTHLDTGDLPALAELDPEQCYLSWTVEMATSRGEQELREVFEFVEH